MFLWLFSRAWILCFWREFITLLRSLKKWVRACILCTIFFENMQECKNIAWFYCLDRYGIFFWYFFMLMTVFMLWRAKRIFIGLKNAFDYATESKVLSLGRQKHLKWATVVVFVRRIEFRLKVWNDMHEKWRRDAKVSTKFRISSSNLKQRDL